MSHKDAALKIICLGSREAMSPEMRDVVLLLAHQVVLLEFSTLQALRFEAQTEHRANLLILDLPFADADSHVLVSFARSLYPSVPIVVSSGLDDLDCMFSAMASGAAGYLLKTSSASMTHEALQTILSGGFFFRHQQLPTRWFASRGGADTPVKVRIPENFGYMPSLTFEPAIAGFTARQREVLDLVTKGFSNKEIARNLGISIGTTKNYVSELLRILRLSNRRQVICHYLSDHRHPEIHSEQEC